LAMAPRVLKLLVNAVYQDLGSENWEILS
jgi:hypothetical protein